MATTDTDHGFEWVVNESGFEAVAEELAPPDLDAAPPSTPELLPTETPAAKPLRPAHSHRRVALLLSVPVLLVLALVWWAEPIEDTRLTTQIERRLHNSWPPTFAPLGVTGMQRVSAQVRAVLGRSELDHVLVDIAYTFTGPGDRQLSFGAWRYFNTEADSVSYARDLRSQLGERREFFGQRLSLRYGEADASVFTPELLAHLDDLLVRACVDWSCPLDLRLTADATWQKAFPMSSAKRNSSLTMALAEIGATPESGDSTIWPSPHLSGYPLNEPTTEYYRRTLALYALTQLAHRLVPGGDDSRLTNNAFFYALVAREAARLGVEPPETLAVRPLPLTTDWYHYWNSRPTWRSAGAQPALNTLNALLHDQPVAVEAEMLRRLVNSDPMVWLAYPYIRAGTAPEIFFNRLRAAQGIAEVSTVTPLTGVNMVLNCDRFPQVVANGQAESLEPLQNIPFEMSAHSWSPDGRHLLLSYFRQPLLVEAATGELKWLATSDGRSWPIAWINDSVIAMSVSDGPQDASVTWLDLANPGRTFRQVSPTYTLSRDKRRAVTWDPIPNSPFSVIRMMDDPIGGPSRSTATGIAPALSPTGDQLAFIRLNPRSNRLALSVLDADGERFIWENADKGVSDPPPAFSVAWSPAGDWIALRIERTQGVVTLIETMLIRADGSQTLSLATRGWMDVTTLFSADGRYIAYLQNEATALPKLEVWELPNEDTAELQPVWDWPGVQFFQWGPTGHELLVFTDQWAGLVREPREGERPSAFTKSQCWSAAWK